MYKRQQVVALSRMAQGLSRSEGVVAILRLFLLRNWEKEGGRKAAWLQQQLTTHTFWRRSELWKDGRCGGISLASRHSTPLITRQTKRDVTSEVRCNYLKRSSRNIKLRVMCSVWKQKYFWNCINNWCELSINVYVCIYKQMFSKITKDKTMWLSDYWYISATRGVKNIFLIDISQLVNLWSFFNNCICNLPTLLLIWRINVHRWNKVK